MPGSADTQHCGREPELNIIIACLRVKGDSRKPCQNKIHSHSQIWFDHVFNNLLNPGGYLIYHDVTNPSYPNLFKIVESAVKRNISYFIFNKNSLPTERCDRGLIVLKKE